jgi:L-lactate utilization protein LutC
MTVKRQIGGVAAALAVISLLGMVSMAQAQSQKQLDLAAARANRKAIVGANMNLNAAEGAAFWPVYEQYEAAMDKIEDRHLAEIKDFAKNYNNMTEAAAKSKLDEVIAVQQARLDTQKEYIPKFRAVISQIKTTRFFQIDNKLQALVQADIAQIVPLAKGSSEPAQQ